MPDGMMATDGAAGPVLCKRCGEAEGTGLACAVCAQVRMARNTPRPDPAEDAMREARRQAAAAPPRPAGDVESTKENTMRLPMRKPGEPMPPLRREAAGRSWHDRGPGPAKPTHTCPDCGVRVSIKGVRCRNCAGIARRKRRPEAPPQKTGGQAAPTPAETPERPERLPAPLTGTEAARLALVPSPRTPAADGPGPLMLAVCNFFGEVARASDHIEARIILDRRRLSITVDLALPGARPENV